MYEVFASLGLHRDIYIDFNLHPHIVGVNVDPGNVIYKTSLVLLIILNLNYYN